MARFYLSVSSVRAMLGVLVGLVFQLPDGYQVVDSILEITFTVPGNVTALDVIAAAAESPFTQVRLGAGVIAVEEGAFYRQQLKQVMGTDDSTVQLIMPRAFGYNADLATVRLPQSVRWIGAYAFVGCGSLRSLDLSSTSVETLGSMVVYACTVLSSVRFPDTLRVLGDYCFDSAKTLSSIDLPASVELLGWSCFYECVGLSEVVADHTQVTEISSWAFAECSSLRTISFPETLGMVGTNAFRGCNSLVDLTLPDSVTVLGAFSFQNCAGITRVHLPTELGEILSAAFQGCRRLRTVTWPRGLRTIGESVFSGCVALTRADLWGATSILYEAFYGCAAMRTVTLGDGLERILTRAFRNCRNLSEVVLPDSLREVGTEAFADCGEIWRLSVGGGITSMASNAFLGVTDLLVVEIRSAPPDELMMTYCMALIPVIETTASLWGPMDEFCGVRTVKLGKGKSKAGPIAGGVIGGLAGAALIAVALFFITKAAGNKKGLAAPAAESYDAIETPLS